MPEPIPAQQVRNLCDQVSDAIEHTNATASVQRLSDAPGGGQAWKAPMHHDTIEARDHLKQTLASWALLIVEERKVEYDSRDEASAVAAWIFQYADWLGAHPAAVDFIAEVEEAIHDLNRISNRGVSSRKFCGWDNGRPIFTEGTSGFSGDGTVLELRNGQDELRQKILTQDLTAKDCAEALKLHDVHVTGKQILRMMEVDAGRVMAEKMNELEALTPVFREGKRQTPYFRVQEVLDRVNRSARRARQQAC